MPEFQCPNLATCKFMNSVRLLSDITQKSYYSENFCENYLAAYVKCKRFIAKSELGFCPDFLLPDSPETIDEIIDIIDKQEN